MPETIPLIPEPDPDVRVLIVDDSVVVRRVLKRMLESDPGIHVIGMAADGGQAVELTAQLRPDLVTMDLVMPGMDGLEATARIMAYHPTPVLFFSSYFDHAGEHSRFDALAAGALDVVEKPTLMPDDKWEAQANALVRKVKALARVPVIAHIRGSHLQVRQRTQTGRLAMVPGRAIDVAAIGVSSGGPRVLDEILPALPPDFALGLIIVQHMAEGFMPGLIEWLQQRCPLPVKVAEEGDAILPGRVLFAPDSAHLVGVAVGTRIPVRCRSRERAPAVGGRRIRFDREGIRPARRGHRAHRHGVRWRRGPPRHAEGGRRHHGPERGELRGLRHAACRDGARSGGARGHARRSHRGSPDPASRAPAVASAMTMPFNRAAPEPVSAAQFARIRNLLERQCGLDFGESRRTSLLAALRARVQSLGIAGLDDYYAHLCEPAGDGELRCLMNLVTITETCFFRDPAQFRMLRRQILPALLGAREALGERRLRIWSAGCSSGEEPYSVALTLCEMGLPLTHRDWTFEIVGTDVNTEMIEAASRAEYSARAVRNIDAECLRRYFTPAGPQFQLAADVTRMVRFEHGSLTQEAPFPAGGCDVILCKNVAIYFRPDVTRRLVRRLHAALNDGGYLLLGHSESLWGIEEGFTLVEHDGVFCYRKPALSETATREGTGSRSAPRTRQAALRLADRPARHEVTLPEGAGIEDPGCADPERCPRGPEPVVGQYERCLEAFRTGDWVRAEAAVLALMSSSPSFVPAHLLLAGIHAHLGRYAEAREQAEHVLRLNDLEPKAHLLLGMVAARAGRQDEAVTSLRRALHLDDSLALAYFWLGNLYRDRGDVERACGEHAEAVIRYERRQLDFTEEFAADLHPIQIVDFCRQSARRVRSPE